MSDVRTWLVPDVTCEHCVAAIRTEVLKVDGVTDVEVDVETKVVAVTGGSVTAVVAAIDEAGYDVAD